MSWKYRKNTNLRKISVDSDFDADWEVEVESKVSRCSSVSVPCEDFIE